jgi:hypothetical protein
MKENIVAVTETQRTGGTMLAIDSRIGTSPHADLGLQLDLLFLSKISHCVSVMMLRKHVLGPMTMVLRTTCQIEPKLECLSLAFPATAKCRQPTTNAHANENGTDGIESWKSVPIFLSRVLLLLLRASLPVPLLRMAPQRC